MKTEELERSLQSVGKACFVKYFEVLSNVFVSREYFITVLMKYDGYTEQSSRTRFNNARKIIKTGYAKRALDNIICSKNVDDATKTRALEMKKYV